MPDSKSITSDREAPPERGPLHDSLSVFLGDWKAEGRTFGRPDQSEDDPKGRFEHWTSTISARWHTGEFFLIHDERAMNDGKAFDTHAILGVDPKTGRCFARTYENHGFERHYDLVAQGNVWTYKGTHERATVTFSEDGRKQTIVWEWKPGNMWLPLCDRVAVRDPHGQARA